MTSRLRISSRSPAAAVAGCTRTAGATARRTGTETAIGPLTGTATGHITGITITAAGITPIRDIGTDTSNLLPLLRVTGKSPAHHRAGLFGRAPGQSGRRVDCQVTICQLPPLL